MRLVIIDGSLEEVLAVLDKVSQDGDDHPIFNRGSGGVEAAGGGDVEADQGGNQKPPSNHAAGEPALSVCDPAQPVEELLSARQLMILQHVMEGSSNKQIARVLGVADATIKCHVRNIMRKIGATNRTQAALWGKEHLKQLERPMPPILFDGLHKPPPSIAPEAGVGLVA